MNSRQILSPIRTPKRVRLLSARWQERGVVLLSAVMLMMTISSCTFKVMDGDNPTESKEMSYLTISAVLDVPTGTSDDLLRANTDGEWTPINATPNKPFAYHNGEGEEDQYAVNTFRILLFDNSGKRYIPKDYPKAFEKGDHLVEEKNPSASDKVSESFSKTYTFPTIEVPKGSYHIVVVANASKTTAQELDNNVRSLQDLKSLKFDLYEYMTDEIPDRRIINKSKLNKMVTQENAGFPMVGELNIANVEGGTKANPIQISDIEIKRVVCYLRMIITNIDKNGNVFPGTNGWRVRDMGVVNGGRNSLLLEQINDPLPLTDLVFWNKNGVSANEWMDVDIRWDNTTGYKSGHIGSFENGTPAKFLYEVYTTEKLGINDPKDYLYYKIVMAKDNETKTYMVPFYGGSDDHPDYNIYRNTLYNVTAYFKGGLLETTVKAVPWSSDAPINKTVRSNEYSDKQQQ